MAKPQIFILFCDDVREEVGNKLSLMGLLGPEIFIPLPEITLKGLVIGALCRFFTPEPVDAEFAVQFVPANGETLSISPPEPAFIKLEPQGNEGIWTSNILGSFQGLSIHEGMRIDVSLKCLGEEFSASLTVERGSVDA
jgi:hypothetical protein